MSTFGLVHGGGLGAWCWELLLPELKARSHHAVTVDLPLENQSAGAAHFAEAVLAAFDEIDDLILVGHSLAGLIVPLVAEQRPVKRLIFIHALLPRPGQSAAAPIRGRAGHVQPRDVHREGTFLGGRGGGEPLSVSRLPAGSCSRGLFEASSGERDAGERGYPASGLARGAPLVHRLYRRPYGHSSLGAPRRSRAVGCRADRDPRRSLPLPLPPETARRGPRPVYLVSQVYCCPLKSREDFKNSPVVPNECRPVKIGPQWVSRWFEARLRSFRGHLQRYLRISRTR